MTADQEVTRSREFGDIGDGWDGATMVPSHPSQSRFTQVAGRIGPSRRR